MLPARRLTATLALFTLMLAACGSSDKEDTAATAPSTEPPAATGTTARSSPATTTAVSGCGVTLSDVQALLPPNSGVTQNRTPDATRCNFTWTETIPRGIDVARVPGGRSAFESQSQKIPASATTLKDGTPFENLSGLGDRAWAYGDSRQVNVVVLKGADLIATDYVVQGTPTPAASKSPTGMDTKWLEICQALAKKALG